MTSIFDRGQFSSSVDVFTGGLALNTCSRFRASKVEIVSAASLHTPLRGPAAGFQGMNGEMRGERTVGGERRKRSLLELNI